MKNLVLLGTFLFVTLLSIDAKNYYVAANGSNSNNGLTATTPWQSITKINSSFSLIVAGDSILFRRGDTFFGALVIGKSGASGRPIVISAYGTGAKPVITGFITAGNWTTVSTGVYQAYIPGAKASLNMVAVNNVPQPLGRYPNATDANGGYLSYESFTGSTSITDNQLTSATSWVGAEVIVRKKLWVLDRCKVTAHSAGKLTFTNTGGSTYDGTNGFGYFFQNDVRTLDQMGEWYFKNSTKYLQMYFGTANPSAYNVKVSTIDTLLVMASKSYISVTNITFEGANANAVYAATGSNLTIQNCDFSNAGVGAVNIQAISGVLIENCTANYSLSSGLVVNSNKLSGITIRNTSVKNTGTLPGMGLSNGNSYKGITASANNLLIEYSTVDTTGYAGIDFQGNNVTIRYNVVNYFDFIKDDAGGIYTYSSGTDANPGTIYTNRIVSNNIVMNGAGAPNGRNSATLFVSGIYLDGRSMNVSVLNNTVFNNGKNGIHTNNPNGITIKGNTSYNNLNAMSVMRWSWGSTSNFSVKNNIFYPKTSAQRAFYYTNSGLNEPATTTIPATLRALGTIDSNRYNMANPTGFNFEIYATSGGALIQATPYSLEAWQSVTSHDMGGNKPVKNPVTYKINSLVGTNKFTNGLFNTGITGLTPFGLLSSWDNTGKISGGSLKISFTAPVANKYGLIHGAIGAVNSAKKYVLRFSTYGTTQQGIVRAYLRKTTSPWNNLVTTQTKSFGVGRKDHEFLFTAPETQSGGSIAIEVEQNSGLTYIDNIEFYEVTATTYDTESQVRFEYNATRNAKTVSLDAKYTGVDGTVYNGSLTLQPFTSVIMVKDTGTTVIVTPPPATALKATAAAAAINCFGGTTSVNVTATGGKSPYTGTGTFTAGAGNGSLKLSFPTGVAGTYTSMYYTIGAISSTKNYVFRFTTLGTTANGKLRAAIRQTFTPWATIVSKQTATFGTTRKDHEFIFTAPPSETGASFVIDIDQGSGTTYIDNIGFFEADADGTLRSANLFSDGQFEGITSKMFFYSGNNNHTPVWDKTGKITSTQYFVVKDADNITSVAAVTIAQPSAALTVTATAGIINVLGGLTNVVVAATGGTAPYTGTGTFSVLAGTFNYTITDSKGCTATATVTILPFSARPATAARSGSSSNARTAQPATGIVTTDKALSLNVSPNPAVTSFSLLAESGSLEKITILVYSADGKQVYQTTGNSNSRYSFGSNFMPGIYILKVIQGGDVQSMKIVKSGN